MGLSGLNKGGGTRCGSGRGVSCLFLSRSAFGVREASRCCLVLVIVLERGSGLGRCRRVLRVATIVLSLTPVSCTEPVFLAGD